MRSHITLAAAFAAFALVITGCTAPGDDPAEPGELQTVRVGTVPLALFAPLFVADAKGYFADEGIELEIQTVTSGQDAIPLVSNGQLDVLIAGFSAGMFNAVSAGLDVQVVGSMNVGDADPENPAASLVVGSAVSDEISEVADLEGRKIALAGGVGGSGAYFTGMVLQEAGLTLEDVTIENLGNPDMPAAIASGAVDAVFTSSPFNSQIVGDGTGVQLATAPEGSSGTGVIYGGQFADTDLAQSFFDALARGAQDLQGDGVKDEENLQIIADATGQELEVVENSPLFLWLPDLAPQPQALSDMEAIWRGVGALTYEDPLDQSIFVNSAFSDAVE